MDKKQEFTYYYSTEEQNEVMQIRKKYSGEPSGLSPIEELRRLDRSTTLPGKIAGWGLSITGILTFGGGLSMILTGGKELFFSGIGVGILGLAILLTAYPLSNLITKHRKKTNASLILELSDKLLGNK